MRDIRDDLKERLTSIRNELESMTKRQELLSSVQQSLFGLLEEEERRFRDGVSLQMAAPEPTPFAAPQSRSFTPPEPAPFATFESGSSGLTFTELPSTPKVAHDSWAELRSGRR